MVDVELKAKRAKYMREWSRGKGAEPIKGAHFHCEVCRGVFEKTGHSQKWCASCKPTALRLQKVAARLVKGHVPIGAMLSCKNCAVQVTKTHKRQFYCLDCSVLSGKDGLPAYRPRQSKYQAARNKQKRLADPSFAIRERMSAQIGQALRGKKAGRRWEQIVGYPLAELMAHLERQFVAGMTWDNRSEWHIDHIVPLVEFVFSGPDDPEIARAWALSNLRPLWASENIRKSGSRTHLI